MACKWWSQVTSVLGGHYAVSQEPSSMPICYVSTIPLSGKCGPIYYDDMVEKKKATYKFATKFVFFSNKL